MILKMMAIEMITIKHKNDLGLGFFYNKFVMRIYKYI